MIDEPSDSYHERFRSRVPGHQSDSAANQRELHSADRHPPRRSR
jgi:hypothetical protein